MKTLIAILVLSCLAAAQHIGAHRIDTDMLVSPNNAPVEAYGAVGDWNGTSGTDNTAAIQACVTAYATSGGTCTFLPRAYKVTGTITISNSGVNLVGADTGVKNSATFNPSSWPVTQIISTSASKDIIDVLGTSSSINLGYNEIRNLRLSRTTIPTGTAAGLNLTFTYGTVVDRVLSEDSIYDFYLKGVAASGQGTITRSQGLWGYNGVTETSGNLYAFYVDSSGAVASPSLRMRDNAAASNISSGPTFYGLMATGSLVSDLHVFHFESAVNINFGIEVNQTGAIGFTNGSDVHLVDSILDNCGTTCILINNVIGTVSIVGGWSNAGSAATNVIDIESSKNVTLADHKAYAAGSSAVIYTCHSSTDTVLANSSLIGGSGTPISMSGCTGGVITGVDINSSTATTLVNYVNTSNVPITNVSLTGSGTTNGFAFDSNSHGNGGLETDTCISGITTCVNDNGSNGLLMPTASGSKLLCATSPPSVTSGFNTGSVSSANGTCSFVVTVGTGAAGSTGVLAMPSSTNGFTCFAQNATLAGQIILQTASGTGSVTFTNYGTTPGTPVNWTNSNLLGVSCFGH